MKQKLGTIVHFVWFVADQSAQVRDAHFFDATLYFLF